MCFKLTVINYSIRILIRRLDQNLRERHIQVQIRIHIRALEGTRIFKPPAPIFHNFSISTETQWLVHKQNSAQ